jgi:hypothetical protein
MIMSQTTRFVEVGCRTKKGSFTSCGPSSLSLTGASVVSPAFCDQSHKSCQLARDSLNWNQEDFFTCSKFSNIHHRESWPSTLGVFGRSCSILRRDRLSPSMSFSRYFVPWYANDLFPACLSGAGIFCALPVPAHEVSNFTQERLGQRFQGTSIGTGVG